MRNVRLFRGLLGVDKRTVIEDIEFDEDAVEGCALVVARVRPRSGVSRRCGRRGNGLIESVNPKIRLITGITFGFADPGPLIALAMLTLGGHRPTLPGRQ